MGYQQTGHYLVYCDRCDVSDAHTGWSTPSIADQAALQAGWTMTLTEHLCPTCLAVGAIAEQGTEAAPGVPR